MRTDTLPLVLVGDGSEVRFVTRIKEPRALTCPGVMLLDAALTGA